MKKNAIAMKFKKKWKRDNNEKCRQKSSIKEMKIISMKIKTKQNKKSKKKTENRSESAINSEK